MSEQNLFNSFIYLAFIHLQLKYNIKNTTIERPQRRAIGSFRSKTPPGLRRGCGDEDNARFDVRVKKE